MFEYFVSAEARNEEHTVRKNVLNVNYSLNPDFYIDAMNVVAKACIEKCGGVYCE